jgi:4'-phosphopantetheinyl transferase
VLRGDEIQSVPGLPAAFDMHPGTVVVVSVGLDLPCVEVERCRGFLSPDEQARAERFVMARDRRRFVVAHGALREVLSGFIGVEPGTIAFMTGQQGKPALAPHCGLQPVFNLSHSEELAVIAVTHSGRLGVDVERLRHVNDAEAIARSFFSPRETAVLEALSFDQKDRAFLTCWTRKEAFLKAIGQGLSYPLDAVEVTIGHDHNIALSLPDNIAATNTWHLRHIEPAPGYIGAIALDGPIVGITETELSRFRARAGVA